MRFKVAFNVSLSAATKKTVIRFNTASSRRGTIERIQIGCNSVTSTDVAIQGTVQQGRGADGTGTADTAILEYGAASGSELGTHKIIYTVEPTAGTPNQLLVFEVPVGCVYDTAYAPITGGALFCPVSSNIAIELTSAQARTSIPVTVWYNED